MYSARCQVGAMAALLSALSAELTKKTIRQVPSLPSDLAKHWHCSLRGLIGAENGQGQQVAQHDAGNTFALWRKGAADGGSGGGCFHGDMDGRVDGQQPYGFVGGGDDRRSALPCKDSPDSQSRLKPGSSAWAEKSPNKSLSQ